MNVGNMGVSVATGAMATTRTPWGADSRARLLASVTTAPFDAAYVCPPGRGRTAAVEAVMRKTPRFWRFITARADRAPSQTPLTLTAMMRSKTASSTSSRGDGPGGTPALAKKMSRLPQAATARSTMAWLSAARVTSAWAAAARPPARSIASTVVLAPASSTSTTSTRAPSLASASADAAPMPEPAPVTTATRSLSFISLSYRARGRVSSPNQFCHEPDGIGRPGHHEGGDAGRLPFGQPLADALARPAQGDLVDERVRDRGCRLLLAP